MSDPLLVVITDYNGRCDLCRAPVHADYLLASDTGELNKRGNKIFYVVGVLPNNEKGAVPTERFYCLSCLHNFLFVHLYIASPYPNSTQLHHIVPRLGIRLKRVVSALKGE